MSEFGCIATNHCTHFVLILVSFHVLRQWGMGQSQQEALDYILSPLYQQAAPSHRVSTAAVTAAVATAAGSSKAGVPLSPSVASFHAGYQAGYANSSSRNAARAQEEERWRKELLQGGEEDSYLYSDSEGEDEVGTLDVGYGLNRLGGSSRKGGKGDGGLRARAQSLEAEVVSLSSAEDSDFQNRMSPPPHVSFASSPLS